MMHAETSPAPLLRLFISTIDSEFKTLHQQIAQVARNLGYQSVSMADWAAEDGELRAWLSLQIDSCDALIHIPGVAYGAEPVNLAPATQVLPAETPRCSYTQYQFLYAQQRSLKTWAIAPGPGCTRDTPLDQLDLDPSLPLAEARQRQHALRQLQQQWLQRLKDQGHVRHQLQDDHALSTLLQKLNDHASELHQRFSQWPSFITCGLQRIEDKQDRTEQGDQELATQLSQVQAALSGVQRHGDPKIDSITSWSQDRLETTLASATTMDIAALRVILTAGKTSLDALLQGQALLACGQRDEAGEKFDLVIQQEQSTSDRLKKAYDGMAQIAYDQAHFEAALAYRQKATDFIEKQADPCGWASAQGEVAYLLDDLGRHQEAEPLMREALRLIEQHLPPTHPDIATALNNVATLLWSANRLKEAEPLMRRALKIDDASSSPDHPNVAVKLNNLATLLWSANRLKEAEPLLRRALKIDEACYGPDHPTVAIRLNTLATLHQAAQRLKEAEPLMRRALRIDEACYGPNHPKVAIDLTNLATLLKATRRPMEAELMMRRALQIDEASYGPDHPHVATDLSNLALLLQATRRPMEAEPLMRRALQIDEARYGPDHPEVAIDLNNLATLLKTTHRLTEAEPLSRRVVALLVGFKRSTGHEHPSFRTAMQNYCTILTAQNLPQAVVLEKLRAVGVH